jgi:hypothetical protein
VIQHPSLLINVLIPHMHMQALFRGLTQEALAHLAQAEGLVQAAGEQDMSEACAALVHCKTQLCLQQALPVRSC